MVRRGRDELFPFGTEYAWQPKATSACHQAASPLCRSLLLSLGTLMTAVAWTESELWLPLNNSQEIMDSWHNDEGTSMGGRRRLSSSSLIWLQHTSPNHWPGPVLALAVLSAEAMLLQTMQDWSGEGQKSGSITEVYQFRHTSRPWIWSLAWPFPNAVQWFAMRNMENHLSSEEDWVWLTKQKFLYFSMFSYLELNNRTRVYMLFTYIFWHNVLHAYFFTIVSYRSTREG